jgi:hypothetical protein
LHGTGVLFEFIFSLMYNFFSIMSHDLGSPHVDPALLSRDA